MTTYQYLKPEIAQLVETGNFPRDYADYLERSGLDYNRQQYVLLQYRDNPHPTKQWFVAVVSAQQAHTQGVMGFMTPLFDLEA